MNKAKTEIVTKRLFVFETCLISLMVILSVATFFTGYHNVDLGFNMERLGRDFGTPLVDECSDGKLRDGSELYSIGLNQIKASFISVIILLIVYCFLLYINFSTPKTK